MSRWVKGVLQLVSKFCWWLSPSKGFSGLIRKAGGGMETQEGGDICILKLIHVVVQQKPTQHCKAIILQLKIKKIKNAEVWNMALECVTMCDFRSSEDLVRFWESH